MQDKCMACLAVTVFCVEKFFADYSIFFMLCYKLYVKSLWWLKRETAKILFPIKNPLINEWRNSLFTAPLSQIPTLYHLGRDEIAVGQITIKFRVDTMIHFFSSLVFKANNKVVFFLSLFFWPYFWQIRCLGSVGQYSGVFLRQN